MSENINRFKEPKKIFSYNLHPDIANRRCEGLVTLDEKQLKVICDNEVIKNVACEDIKELITDMGVGCVFVSYRAKDESVHLLCRLDLKNSDNVIKTVRRINRYFEDGIFIQSENEESNRCEKCGRPYSKSSHTCVYCSGRKQLFKRVWEFLSPYKLFVFGAVIMFFVSSGLNLLLPYINRLAVDKYIQAPEGAVIELYKFVLIMLSMLILELVLRGLSSLRSHLLISASSRMKIDLRNNLFDKVQRLSISKTSKHTAGDLMYRINNDTAEVERFLVNYLPTVFQQLAVFIMVGIYIIFYDPLLFVLIMLPTPFVVMSFNFFWRFMRVLFGRRRTTAAKTNSILHDIFSGIRVVKAFGMEKKESERFKQATGDEKYMQEKTDCIWSIIMPILRFFISFGEFIILFYVGNRILGGTMTYGEMSQFSSYASMIYGPLRMIAHIPRNIMRFTTSSAKIIDILDEDEEIFDSDKPVDISIKGDIDINNISFGYDGGNEVLHKIDLHIKSGEFIGLVGASGVGKSTLINLIMRLYDVEDGSIMVDSVNIKDISQEALRSQIGVVLQETFLFSGSVAQNIAYAKPDATKDEIIAVSKLAGCHSFIMRLPDGYNTRVGEKGMTLSGGERQRIAIARALLHNPRILILDEATASLDTETEKQIQDALARLSKDRTTIAIAHRLSTLRNATRLVVLDKGKVAEVGTHDELIEKKGIYYSLVMAQREMSDMNA